MIAIYASTGSVLIRLALGAALALFSPGSFSQAARAPDRAVEIILNTAPGSGPDRTARTLQKIWQDQRSLGVSTTVSNRPGGGGAVAYTYLNQKAGDGHFISIASSSLVTNNVMGRGPGHMDVTVIARLFGEYIAVAVRPDSKLKTGRDMIELLKNDPGALSFGIATSLGNSNHQAVALAPGTRGPPGTRGHRDEGSGLYFIVPMSLGYKVKT